MCLDDVAAAKLMTERTASRLRHSGFSRFLSMILLFSSVTAFLQLLTFSDAFTLLHSPIQLRTRIYESSEDHASSAAAVEEESPFLDVSPINGAQSHQQRRVLGSQELLMLPRQYVPNKKKNIVRFPQMNHVSVVTLSATPDVDVLRKAVDAAIQVHPLLQARVEGDGEPDKRIDLFQMVRKGDPRPLTFVSEPGMFNADDGLTVVDTDHLERSWKAAFVRDLDDGSWCDTKTGPLWKVELHRSAKVTNVVHSCSHSITPSPIKAAQTD